MTILLFYVSPRRSSRSSSSLNVCHLPWAGFFTTLKGDKALTYRAALGTALDPAASAFAVASAVVASCPSARLGVVAVAVEVAVSV